MLPNNYCQNIVDKVNSFLWRQWSQLGIAGGGTWNPNWIIDPENLILFTLDAGRLDARLFDEVVDWLLTNERWISLQRINGLVKHCNEQTALTLCALALFMDRHTTHSRWKKLAQCHSGKLSDPIPFFQRTDFQAMPVIGDPDPSFLDVGLVRSLISVRGLSKPVASASPSNVIFHLRLLFGVSPRAEIIACLLSHDRAEVSDFMRITGYSRPSILDVLNDLSKGGYVSVFNKNNRYIFSLNADRWKSFLFAANADINWPNWAAIYSALRKVYAYLNDLRMNPDSDYILRSKSVRLAAAIRQDLSDSRFINPWAEPVNIDNVMDLLPNQIMALLDHLNNTA